MASSLTLYRTTITSIHALPLKIPTISSPNGRRNSPTVDITDSAMTAWPSAKCSEWCWLFIGSLAFVADKFLCKVSLFCRVIEIHSAVWDWVEIRAHSVDEWIFRWSISLNLEWKAVKTAPSRVKVSSLWGGSEHFTLLHLESILFWL